LKRFLVTAGPTREYIDSVRFLTNASTGRTGYLIAEEAARRGAPVVLIAGPTALPPPAGVTVTPVVSAEEMARAVMNELPASDVVIGTAAVADWRPAERAPTKLSKQRGELRIRWVKTPDILELAGRRKEERLLIGFALEDENPREKALEKLERKNLDYIVLNGPENLGSEGGTYELLGTGGRSWPLGYQTKEKLARLLVSLALEGESALRGQGLPAWGR
jgi:phosphopantothenoylcysteine decarboxylase / phosphopantothenate---cysteine ligase